MTTEEKYERSQELLSHIVRLNDDIAYAQEAISNFTSESAIAAFQTLLPTLESSLLRLKEQYREIIDELAEGCPY